MHLRKPLRRWIASWLALTLLLTQFATAAYACPMLAAATPMPCATTMSAAAPQALDPELPSLCLHHCQDGSQSAVELAGSASLAAPALLPAFTVRVAMPAGPAAWSAHQRQRARVPAPTHSILHCCYRI